MTDLRIGILGAPGSGKSSFGKALATAIRKERGETKRQTVRLVDGYVNNLQKKTGYAFDIHGTLPQNFQIQFERWTREQEAEHDGCEVLITTGSMYETILYTALRSNSDLVLSKGDRAIQMHARIAQEMLGVIQSLTATHDLLFYLPYTDKVSAEKGRSYDAAINAKLPEVVGQYFRPMTPLSGTLKRKVSDALKHIQKVEEWKAQGSAVDDQPPV